MSLDITQSWDRRYPGRSQVLPGSDV